MDFLVLLSVNLHSYSSNYDLKLRLFRNVVELVLSELVLSELVLLGLLCAAFQQTNLFPSLHQETSDLLPRAMPCQSVHKHH
jgi:hypothetical protein